MLCVLIVGYGDLGKELGRKLVEQGFYVAGLSRSKRQHDDSVTLLMGDVTRPETLTDLPTINPQILVYCVAADAQSDDSYRAHYVDGLRHVLQALDRADHLQHVFFVSSTRVYGQTTDTLLSDDDPALPVDFGGQRLMEAEQLLTGLTCGHTALRLSGIYGPGRTRMLKLAADPTHWPPNTWSNRIHRDDAAAFIAFLIQRAMKGEQLAENYIVTDNQPTPQHEVLRWLAGHSGVDVSNIHTPPPVGGKRLANQRLRETGFQLTYPDYQAGYTALLLAETASQQNS